MNAPRECSRQRGKGYAVFCRGAKADRCRHVFGSGTDSRHRRGNNIAERRYKLHVLYQAQRRKTIQHIQPWQRHDEHRASVYGVIPKRASFGGLQMDCRRQKRRFRLPTQKRRRQAYLLAAQPDSRHDRRNAPNFHGNGTDNQPIHQHA